jgi:hypothetical protein
MNERPKRKTRGGLTPKPRLSAKTVCRRGQFRYPFYAPESAYSRDEWKIKERRGRLLCKCSSTGAANKKYNRTLGQVRFAQRGLGCCTLPQREPFKLSDFVRVGEPSGVGNNLHQRRHLSTSLSSGPTRLVPVSRRFAYNLRCGWPVNHPHPTAKLQRFMIHDVPL